MQQARYYSTFQEDSLGSGSWHDAYSNLARNSTDIITASKSLEWNWKLERHLDRYHELSKEDSTIGRWHGWSWVFAHR